MPRSATQKGRLTILAGCAAALVVTLGALRADLMVSHGFGKALGAHEAPLAFDMIPRSGTLQHAGANYSLTRAQDGILPPFAQRIAVGDRITISGGDGRERVLVVIDVKPIGDPLTRIAAHARSTRLLVICRLVGGPEQEAHEPIEFIVQGHAAEPQTLPPSAPKAL
jgi:hypothetical protein